MPIVPALQNEFDALSKGILPDFGDLPSPYSFLEAYITADIPREKVYGDAFAFIKGKIQFMDHKIRQVPANLQGEDRNVQLSTVVDDVIQDMDKDHDQKIAKQMSAKAHPAELFRQERATRDTKKFLQAAALCYWDKAHQEGSINFYLQMMTHFTIAQNEENMKQYAQQDFRLNYNELRNDDFASIPGFKFQL